MDWLVIEGVRPWDGRYEFDLVEQPPTQREWGWIKRFSAYLPLTIDQGMSGGDPELYGAFAVMALYRAGRIQPTDAQDIFDRFQDVPFGAAVRLELDAVGLQDGDAGPPARSSDGSTNGSGDSTKTSSGMWAPPDGTPASATSESVPATSPT